MRRGLIPVLILADVFDKAFVTASLDMAFHWPLESASLEYLGQPCPGHDAGLRPADSRGRLSPHELFLSRGVCHECCLCIYIRNPQSGVACHLPDARLWAGEG